MPSLTHRSHQSELMDDPGVPFSEFQQTLKEIEKINRITLAYRPTLQAIQALAKKGNLDNKPLRILDIGFGNGDFLRRIDTWSKKKGVVVELTGIDLNPWAERAARDATKATQYIQYVTCNAFEYAPPKPFHIIINSLFTHHLADAEIVHLMQWMTANASLGWIINDLHRHIIPYQFIRSYVRAFGFNRLVQNDAPLSVARAFKSSDWKKFIREAKLTPNHISLSWHFPFRYRVLYAC